MLFAILVWYVLFFPCQNDQPWQGLRYVFHIFCPFEYIDAYVSIFISKEIESCYLCTTERTRMQTKPNQTKQMKNGKNEQKKSCK